MGDYRTRTSFLWEMLVVGCISTGTYDQRQVIDTWTSWRPGSSPPGLSTVRITGSSYGQRNAGSSASSDALNVLPLSVQRVVCGGNVSPSTVTVAPSSSEAQMPR